MTDLIEYLKERFIPGYAQEKEHALMLEMANIQKGVNLDSIRYNIAVHGASSKDRDYPHLHIYLTGDNSMKQFNFEISIVDLLCDGELRLIKQLDRTKRKKIDRRNKTDCSWEGYSKLLYDLEDWLEAPYKHPNVYVNNLQAVVGEYNDESEDISDNYILDYIRGQKRKIDSQYHHLFSEDDKEKFKECF